MGISQEAEKLQVKCSSNIIFFFEFAWILANIAAAQMLPMCTEHTDLFAISLCVKHCILLGPGESQDAGSKPKCKKINALDFKEQQNT